MSLSRTSRPVMLALQFVKKIIAECSLRRVTKAVLKCAIDAADFRLQSELSKIIYLRVLLAPTSAKAESASSSIEMPSVAARSFKI